MIASRTSAALRRDAKALLRRAGLGGVLTAYRRVRPHPDTRPSPGATSAPLLSPRDEIAHAHLRGEGVEIGALHMPVRVPPGVFVKYVDNTSRIDNVRRFPELDPSQILQPDYLGDGLHLGFLEDDSQDFVIANHVLEHAPVPLRVLDNWARVLKPEGCLLVSVPMAETCFDAGRVPHDIAHHIEDHRLSLASDTSEAAGRELAEHNLEHYVEWVSISEPAIIRERGDVLTPSTEEEFRARAEALQSQNIEIHYHAFDAQRFESLLKHFCSQLRPAFDIVELRDAGTEAIALLRRRAA